MPPLIEAHAEPIPGYRLIERLGMGGFGEVWKASAPGGLLKAIKIIHGDLRTSDPDESRHATQELRALKRVQAVRHPYLLSLERYDIIDGKLLIVMELADCNLWDRFRQYRNQGLAGIPRDELLRYMEETAEVLDMMNSQHQLQHLDIKPQNLFLIYNHIKVADFGLVKDLEGMRAAVTGGVTPVYAAPETFDGVVTRFCDQYSLAIVFQELLTGQRPFNGSSMQQLLMQHLQGTPNLAPAPASDRPALARALAKKPEDRFPSCLALVQALQQGDRPPVPRVALPDSSATNPSDAAASGAGPTLAPGATIPPRDAHAASGLAAVPNSLDRSQMRLPYQQPMDTPVTQMRVRREELVDRSQFTVAQPARVAPPEIKGEGSLRPALLIGAGQCGLETLTRFRRGIAERFGAFEKAEQLRLLFIDTDPDTLQTSTLPTMPTPLHPDEVMPARLNRPGHYLKPRRNGRSLIEGWFDPQMLYRIPRNPVTQGIRAMGRLALCDHYRVVASRMVSQLEGCTHPDTLARADRHLQIGLRTNRPRVYVIASLGGGTGSGMFVDLAYIARHKLKSLGYTNPEVIGVLYLPPVEHSPHRQSVMANCYAALTELNHYCQAGTNFQSSYDDRDGNVDDPEPPFREILLFGLPPTAPGANAPPAGIFSQVSDYLCRELTSPFGRSIEFARAKHSSDDVYPVPIRTFGSASFSWPRRQLISQAANAVCGQFLQQWTNVENPRMAQAVESWVKELWKSAEFGPEKVIQRLQQIAEHQLGQPADAWFAAQAEPFVPRGWMGQGIDPHQLWDTLNRLQQIVGMPDEIGLQRQSGQFEHLLTEAADYLIREYTEQVKRVPLALVDQPDYRLIGGEQSIHALHSLFQQTVTQYEPLISELNRKANESFYLISETVLGERKRRTSQSEIAEAVKQFPRWRYQSLLLRQVCRIYSSLRAQLSDQLRELNFARKRLEELGQYFQSQKHPWRRDGDTYLLPAGISTMDQAVKSIVNSLSPDDFRILDRQLQSQIETEFVNLSHLCLTSRNLGGDLQTVLLDQARTFLNSRLGEADVVEMFLNRYPTQEHVNAALGQAYQSAAPELGRSRRSQRELDLLGIANGPYAERVRLMAQHALPQVELDLADARGEILFHRENLDQTLIDLPHLGPVVINAYQAAIHTAQYTPHTRTDVAEWIDIEAS
ncbi:tubulin-like doman-containing protein [Tuwongella immobilis]|uniref:Protein kinase domain-containing protein n=1 Tax=Tuwongella immobilis TaxID=692036 RepID=A0A6C2YN88_9BACT|nr:tubulin-like doman-containing protein [Tuwongella immobilis]VIP02751.1 serine threonine protein kinase : Serine/threonine protein kinase OS=Pirellula staleyi (strain ATCC 27377 / DSM 6068 / ICPB 4128) GN=Psta_0486 PE=4 SV=1: Pkinase: Tubulin_2 [Tuwongella immobilis]VTS02342.1 serine threonine protein kinase : Serine/threonine protein kinase OS=Pirellula staleyi (strain ATCC 27377 / DSM 6068 / ICPB 4128) GN=Psta_0486 PE=4 SV=1: Pkinase: Tubulin_2 [Tuwongella immobilis]